MLELLGAPSVDALIAETVPAAIRSPLPLSVTEPLSEQAMLALAARIGAENTVTKSYIGMGYSDCITPPVILRNVVQNPGWYTQYTPYQAEIAQGRLEALLNFQTMIIDLTGLEIANASLLDEGTAAAEAMHLAHGFRAAPGKQTFFVSSQCHPQTIEVVMTRARPLGIHVEVGDHRAVDLAAIGAFGALVQYPGTHGEIFDYRDFGVKAHGAGALFVVACDLLSLALLVPPGELGADVALGNSQRFGVPLGYGGPHAAFFATKNEFVRKLPGRIIGVSQDAQGRPALRMALQTREQHIRREKATSNICTAQALLAVVASMYAVYHGPEGIRAIASQVHGSACVLAAGLARAGLQVETRSFFDTITLRLPRARAQSLLQAAALEGINLRPVGEDGLGISVDETTTPADLAALLELFGAPSNVHSLAAETESPLGPELRRTSPYLTHPVFGAHHSETSMLRYMRKLEGRDLSLAHSMIPLGSCTMKLNATAEMMPLTDPCWSHIHPYAPVSQASGYSRIFADLEAWLSEITGLAGVSLQPNAGAQGEYAGLLAIRAYHESRGDAHRRVCLIPSSAHGTNPASAVLAGMDVVVVACDAMGNVDLVDLEAKTELHKDRLGALMVTYPSTHGVFEAGIKDICALVHSHGGQVYMDGANMNAQVGLTSPGAIGADVCHLNLHKTFCIPHGGGGPGMGPIAVASHLVPFLPRKPVVDPPPSQEPHVGPVSAAPWGSASILLISWAYIQMMGGSGLTEATKVAILNANYIAARLEAHYPLVYKGERGRVAHECILDMRGFKKTSGIEVDDIAKRLMDYGFHAPTMSFPIPGTLMVEPTESESKAELDRFCDAMIGIREEIRAVEAGRFPRDDNPLKNAPHTIEVITAAEWKHPYPREVAAFPAPWTRDRKFFPSVGRLNNALGDRKLICACPPTEAYI